MLLWAYVDSKILARLIAEVSPSIFKGWFPNFFFLSGEAGPFIMTSTTHKLSSSSISFYRSVIKVAPD